MKKITCYLIIVLYGFLSSSYIFSADKHSDEHKHEHDDHATPHATPASLSPVKIDPNFPEINWPALAPAGWDSVKVFQQFNFSQYRDGDPKADAELKKLRSAFNKAPVDEKMNGKKITIAGYMVPVKESKGRITEFLLVAFYGACIHEPPPPANQIVYVTANEPLEGLEAMSPVTVKGVIKTAFTDSPMGGAGYRMERAHIDPHVTKRCLFAPTCE